MQTVQDVEGLCVEGCLGQPRLPVMAVARLGPCCWLERDSLELL
jgi:hypothetical protein